MKYANFFVQMTDQKMASFNDKMNGTNQFKIWLIFYMQKLC